MVSESSFLGHRSLSVLFSVMAKYPSLETALRVICDPGMSSQIPWIGEYQSMAHRRLRPPEPNVEPIVPEGSHSLTLPNGSYNLFSFSPPSSDIPCIIYSSQCCL